MNENEFNKQLDVLSERVLSKALTPDEENSYTESLFESIRHVNEYEEEFWYARELSKVLEYKDFRNFELTIFKAMEACKNSDNEVADHFGEVTEMVSIGSSAKQMLSCYFFTIFYGG